MISASRPVASCAPSSTVLPKPPKEPRKELETSMFVIS